MPEKKREFKVSTRDYTLNPKDWVKEHADYLYAFALARITDEELAKDLVQETFLAGLEQLGKFEGRSAERTWLTAILKNKIVDIYRKRSSVLTKMANEREEATEQDDFFDAETGHWKEEHSPRLLGVEDKDPLLNKELAAILKLCMRKLPSLWLAVFTMKHIEEEPADVICRELKVTAANFWVLIHRAKVNLRACLQKNWI